GALQANRQERDGKVRSRLAGLLKHADCKGKWPGLSIEANAPQDFNEIGDVAKPKGYIGFIYCDGNRMGDVLSKLRTRESFKAFSEGVHQILEEMTFEALLKHFPEQRRLPGPTRAPVLPFEIIFSGGDDMVLVVAADKAIELASNPCDEFERRTEPLLQQVGRPDARDHLSLSAALLLAHSSLPIY